ncbi:MAG: hypothetical protein P9C36_02775 [Defluviicoccus sp.]|nr:hypothetical protein [Defluviicoccus sp.]MDG4591532.1 hypothetical protein [Defluviicoccus sp.]
MLDRDIPDTGHGRLRLVEATAWLAAVELRQHRPEAALICEAIEILVEVLSSFAVDRDGTHVRVAAFVAHALRQYSCDPSLHGMLEAVAEAADGSDGEASVAAEEALVKSAMALWRARRAAAQAHPGNGVTPLEPASV